MLVSGMLVRDFMSNGIINCRLLFCGWLFVFFGVLVGGWRLGLFVLGLGGCDVGCPYLG